METRTSRAHQTIIAALLLVTLMFTTAACGSGQTNRKSVKTSSIIDTSYQNNEVGRAIELGYVPKALQSKYQSTITHKELYTLIDTALEKQNSSAEKKWSALSSQVDDNNVCRIEGAMFLFDAAQLMGSDKVNGIIEDNTMKKVDLGLDKWSGVSIFKRDENVTFDFEEKGQGDPFKAGRDWASVNYVLQRRSLYSNNPVMELDDKLSFRGNDYMTREEAILAVVRLMDSILPKPDYVSPEQAVTSTISKAAIASAKKMPAVTSSALPSSWKGSTIDNRVSCTNWSFAHPSRAFYESDIRYLAENGFNFTRVQFGLATLTYPDHLNSADYVNLNELKSLDELVTWGMKYGVHIQLANFSIPGRGNEGYFNGELYTDDQYYPTEKEWETLKQYWVMIATRYKDIPSDYLTFDLMNEWHPDNNGKLSDFTKHWSEIIAAIHQVDPNRVLCASFDSDLNAAKAIAKLGVCIEYHAYIPRDLTANDDNSEKKTWPYTDSKGKKWTINDVWDDIQPFYNLAKQSNVGFMISEWDIWSKCPENTVVSYTRDMVKMFADHNLAWCQFELSGPKNIIYDVADFNDRQGAVPTKVTYKFSDYSHTFYEDRAYTNALMGK